MSALKASMSPRPLLPWKYQNTEIKKIKPKDMPAVKYQLLDRDGQEVLVGRMKIPTPGGHAFILRRFDTSAVSLTTMYRAAFPGAPEAEERKETQFVKETYDLTGNNGSAKEPTITRLAGTWVDPDLAVTFAETYMLGDLITLMTKAQPDPTGNYRRSSKANSTPKGTESAPTTSIATSSPSIAAPSAAKRRKESSPAPSAPEKAVSPPPRRSSRMRSVQPEPVPAPRSVTTPKSTKKTRRTATSSASLVAAGSDEATVVEEDEEIAAMAGPDMSQDVAEQKELIKNLKAARAAARAGVEEDDIKPKRLREDEDEQLLFEFKEPEVGERAIVVNRKASRFAMEPRTKSVAWGALAFAVGMGAMTYLPNFL